MRRWLILMGALTLLLWLPAGCSTGRTSTPGVQQTASDAGTPELPAQQAASGPEIPEPEETPAEEAQPQEEEETMESDCFYITAGGTTFAADFADNSSAQALQALLERGDLTLTMSDYGDFEKVGSLGTQLPRNDEQITTGPGDVILYQGSSITIYYDTNTWNFTRLGKIRDVTREDLLAALGEGDVEVTFSLTGPEQ